MYAKCICTSTISSGNGFYECRKPFSTTNVTIFPQEKLYLQTDRGIYMSGETLWFRTHLVDALMLKQANASRYVYVELVNPLGNLVERVKIRPDSLGCFYGHIPLGEDLPEGNYSLRAYTWFMQNIGEEYFSHKLIYISDPVSEAISPEISYSAENNDVHAEIHFLSKPDNRSVTPTQAILFPDGDRDKKRKSLIIGRGKYPLHFQEEGDSCFAHVFCYRQCMTERFPIAISESPN